MLIEYKAPSVRITQKVFTQIAVYNRLLHVDYLIISNGLESYCAKMDYQTNRLNFLRSIPFYEQL